VKVNPIFIIRICIANLIPSSQELRKASKFITFQVNALIQKQMLYINTGKFSELNHWHTDMLTMSCKKN